MIELFQTAFSPVNIPLSTLLILIVVYWSTVILGVMDINFLDFDLPDAGLESDIDGDLDAEFDGSFMRSVLAFFYVGEIPIMIILSILILFMWMVSMIANHHLNPTGSLIIGFPIFIGNFIISLFACKFFTMPLKKIFNVFEVDANASRSVIGRICIVKTTKLVNQLGQAEVNSKGAPIVLNVMAQSGCTFVQGEEAVVVEKNKENGVYIIAPIDLEKKLC